MAEATDLSGVWEGHYEQHGRRSPIRADWAQRGDRLEGTMRDLEPEQARPVEELAAEAGLPPGADEQIVARLRAMVPEAEGRPIRFVAQLPPESALEGTVQGRVVEFVKTYLGESFGGYRVGEQLVGRRHPGHSVRYRGRIGPDGDRIEGEWWIDPPPGQGGRRAEGLFALRREG